MSYHTPAPWVWDNDSNLHGGTPADSVLFGTVEYDDGHYSELHCTTEDRALISAAPDLLTALTELVLNIPPHYSDTQACRFLKCNRGQLDRARSAIAKAIGESQ